MASKTLINTDKAYCRKLDAIEFGFSSAVALLTATMAVFAPLFTERLFNKVDLLPSHWLDLRTTRTAAAVAAAAVAAAAAGVLSLLNWRRQASLFVLNFLFPYVPVSRGPQFPFVSKGTTDVWMQSTSVLLGKYRMSGLIALPVWIVFIQVTGTALGQHNSLETKKLATSWMCGKMFHWFLELFLAVLFIPSGRGWGDSLTIGVGCAAGFPKHLPYSWPKYAIFTAIFF